MGPVFLGWAFEPMMAEQDSALDTESRMVDNLRIQYWRDTVLVLVCVYHLGGVVGLTTAVFGEFAGGQSRGE